MFLRRQVAIGYHSKEKTQDERLDDLHELKSRDNFWRMQADGFMEARYKLAGSRRGRKRKAVSVRLKDPIIQSNAPWCGKCKKHVSDKGMITMKEYLRLKYQHDPVYRKQKMLRGTAHYHKGRCKKFIMLHLQENSETEETHPSPSEPPQT